MDQEPVLTPLDSESGVRSYRDKSDYIYPLPAFVTKATFDKPSYPTPPRSEPPPPAMGDDIADFSM